ncbi:gamma-glutamyltransferase [Tunicatimonas pelagia]|uniref:gamma-glutamyltransferase n=1 Tax=Tunicatimonas pelagia TaxID=931531 RepID=UPI0026651722|nr:gamma-glutamyltransferase [Tunicatimonas pelagia]WKN43744.1 gamma-glutamyltransferase [Tunicatimonas pelagia]
MRALLFFFLLLPTLLFAQDRLTGEQFATRSEVIAQHGMAATSQPLATQTALYILRQGGNAIDAAIAANAVLGLTEPTGNGIGGDLFAIVWNAENEELLGLNASGRSPYDLSLAYFEENGHEEVPYRGPLSVSVPGCVSGWFALHEKMGSLPMTTILQPAIDYARDGFPLTEVIASGWRGNARVLQQYEGFSDVFMPNGRTPEKGEIFKNPGLANTLEKIAQEGQDAFYKGEIAKTITDYIKKQGGLLSTKDLADHTADWVEPVSTNYRGYEVYELPPNGQGTAVLQMLNILEGYDLASMGFGSAEYIHHLVEAKKIAYEDRAKYYADPDFVQIPMDQLISKEYAQARAKLIDPDRAGREYPAGELEQGNTIYMTVADGDGNMISLIQSNYSGMGSGMTPPGLGFILQNRGALFSLEEGHNNVYEPHKRPFHTIIPAFVTKNGKPYLSFGLMGGAMQPQGHVQVLVNMIDFGMNVQEAGDAPRINHASDSQPTGGKMTDGGILRMETGFSSETIQELMRKRHTVQFARGVYGGYQAIKYDAENDVYIGASESRKDGQAAGY